MTRLILIGAGHAHAQVLRDWIAQPVAGVELVVISPSALAPYSGMVPGWLAGTYRFEEICIDFESLCRRAGAQWVADEVLALDADQRMLMLRSGQVMAGDVLSINIGSTLRPPSVPGARVLSMRPLGDLRQAWEKLQSEIVIERTAANGTGAIAITAVGGGAAGVESLLAVTARLRALGPGRSIQGRLVTRSATLLPGMSRGAARSAQRVMQGAGLTLQTDTAFDGSAPPAGDAQHLVLWATGAQAHRWPAQSTLAVDEAGFIRINDRLQSISHPKVFAVGDCAQWERPLPKAGVFAVRMGPVLSANLRAALGPGDAQAYQPQRRYLALLATADGQAIASWGDLWARGRWAWRWKDQIDRGFLARFADPAQALNQSATRA